MVLRRHRPEDLDALQEAVDASVEHLRPWMPWAGQDRTGTAEFLARSVREWDDGSGFGWLVLDAGEQAVLGAGGLMRRVGPGALEIGYWLRPEATGRGIVTAVVRELIAAGMARPGIERIEIHCDEANVRSAAVARRLGFRLDRVEDDDVAAPGELGRAMIWVLEP